MTESPHTLQVLFKFFRLIPPHPLAPRIMCDKTVIIVDYLVQSSVGLKVCQSVGLSEHVS